MRREENGEFGLFWTTRGKRICIEPASHSVEALASLGYRCVLWHGKPVVARVVVDVHRQSWRVGRASNPCSSHPLTR